MPPYVYERQVEYWTSRQVEEFFLDAGYEVLVSPVTPMLEKRLPADFLFLDKGTSKLFGFQYKSLYPNSRDHWKLDIAQHQTLLGFPWIYYCFSELRDVRDQRASLHLARIATPSTIPSKSEVPAEPKNLLGRYFRWGAFYEGLRACSTGVRISSSADLAIALNPHQDPGLAKRLREAAIHVFFADPVSRRAVHVSPTINPEGWSDE